MIGISRWCRRLATRFHGGYPTDVGTTQAFLPWATGQPMSTTNGRGKMSARTYSMPGAFYVQSESGSGGR